MYKLFFPLMLLLLIFAAAATQAQEPVFLEQDGIVMIEVESVPAAKGWEVTTELAGFTGKSYYKHIQGGGPMHYRFRIMEAGEYQFRIHNRHDHHDSTLENDCWVSLNGGPRVKLFSWKGKQWTYTSNHEFSHSNKKPAKYDLPIGEHVITISGRSPNFMIDHLLLYRTGKKNAEKKKHVESTLDGGVDYRKLEHLKSAKRMLQTRRFGSAWKAAQAELASEEAAVKAEAKLVSDGIAAYVIRYKTSLESVKTQTPALATEKMKQLSKQMKGSPWDKELSQLASAWSKEPATKQDVKAEALLKKAIAVNAKLSTFLQGNKVKDDAEIKRFGKYIAPLIQISKKLDKDHAGSRAQTMCNTFLDQHGIAHLK